MIRPPVRELCEKVSNHGVPPDQFRLGNIFGLVRQPDKLPLGEGGKKGHKSQMGQLKN
jgi:hypothetical protein